VNFDEHQRRNRRYTANLDAATYPTDDDSTADEPPDVRSLLWSTAP
jgi:hypothetical protein